MAANIHVGRRPPTQLSRAATDRQLGLELADPIAHRRQLRVLSGAHGGLDPGVGDDNTVRSAYGLSEVESFADITSDSDVQKALTDAYVDMDDLDLWPAALAEDHLEGASVGETLQAVIGDQFRRWSSSRRQSWSRAAAARCGRSARRRTLRGLMFTPQSGFVQPRLAGCRGDSAA